MASPSRGGAFDQAPERIVELFTESITFDQRLFSHDIAGSIAHAQMLSSVGLISSDECRQLVMTLLEIESEIRDGRFEFRTALEDIHMHIEQELIDRLGDVGRKLHTGRSRNDQISNDLRLWTRDEIDRLDLLLIDLQTAFLDRCDKDQGVILPAYTHLQRAQPVLAAHYWLAYCEKFQRDRGRLADCRRRLNESSLGTAALAGTAIPIDRQETAESLGFSSMTANSLDSSSDRDFVLEACFAASLIGVHLSGWAEEWILWSTSEFRMIRLPQSFCTGSSIMPHKINPDTLELTRGKAARVIGNLQTLFVLIKGLPLAYNRDLQEDKPPLFDTMDTVRSCLEIAIPIVSGAELNRESIAERLEDGFLDATTLMEYLIQKGVPQRTAHHAVGGLVRKAMDAGVTLSDLELSDYQAIVPDLDEELYEHLGTQRAVESFASVGSTRPQFVDEAVEHWRSRLKQEPAS